MTVSATTSRADYTGNGVTTGFAVPFYFLDQSHITVLRTQISTGVSSTLTITTDYTVIGAGVAAGGTVTLTTAPTADQKISILRNAPFTQLVHYVPNDPFPAATHEQALDQLTMEVQQLNEGLSRSLSLSKATTGVSTTLPNPSANLVIGWNTNGTALVNVDANTLATNISYGQTNAMRASGTGAQTAYTLTSTAAAVNNLQVYISGVRQTPTTDYTLAADGISVTFTSAPPSGTNNILFVWQAVLPIGTPADGSVTPAKLSSTADYTFGGNVGIGVMAPAYKLDIATYTSGTTNTQMVANFIGNTAYTAVGKWAGVSFGTQYAKTAIISYDNYNNFGRNDLIFAVASGANFTPVTLTDEKMRLDNAGNLGIGLTPSANWNSKLQVKMPSATAYNGISVQSSADQSGVYIGHTGALGVVGTTYGATGSHTPLTLWTSDLERVRVDTSGNIGIGRSPTYQLDVNSTARFNSTIGVGNTAPAASGAGVSFPATQSASSDANTLDDYEEGTATITLTCTTGSITLLAGYNVVTYVKIGRAVTIQSGRIYVNSVSSPTGGLRLSGLPFTSASGAQGDAAFSIHGNFLSASATTALQARMDGGASSIIIERFSAGSSIDDVAGFCANNTQFRIGGTYYI